MADEFKDVSIGWNMKIMAYRVDLFGLYTNLRESSNIIKRT